MTSIFYWRRRGPRVLVTGVIALVAIATTAPLTLPVLGTIAGTGPDMSRPPAAALPSAPGRILAARAIAPRHDVPASISLAKSGAEPLPSPPARAAGSRAPLRGMFDLALQSMTALPARLDAPTVAAAMKVERALEFAQLASAAASAVETIPEPVEVIVPRPRLVSGGTMMVATVPAPVEVHASRMAYSSDASVAPRLELAAQARGTVVVTTGSLALTSFHSDGPIPMPKLLSQPSLSRVALAGTRTARPAWSSAWREARAVKGGRLPFASMREIMLVGQ